MDWGNRPPLVKVTAGASICTCAVTWRLRCTSDCVDGAMTGKVLLFFMKTLPVATCAAEPSPGDEIDLDSISKL